MGVLAWANHSFFTGAAMTLMIGYFGASAVLVYGAARSPLAQPRNLVGGHIVSALVSVTACKLFQHDPWLAKAMAVSTAIAAMHMTRTLHPPGGATAVIGSNQIQDLGYLYVVVPATAGPILLLLVGLLVNNIPQSRHYPEIWL
jgi:CBS-domain-containing membrane protein